MRESSLRSYAALLLDVGLGLGEGSLLRIVGEFPHREFMYLVAEAAYERGARLVRIEYDDQRLQRIRVDHSAEAYLDRPSGLLRAESEAFVAEGWSQLRIEGYEDGSVLEGADQARLTRMQRARGPAVRALREAQMGSRLAWCVAPAATEAWARAVFGPEGDAERLWESLAPILRLDQPDPAAATAAHLRGLEERARRLTELAFRELRFWGGGTELCVRLSPRSLWLGGADRRPDGLVFAPNLPTEEVFTTPDFRGTEGVVALTRPVRIRGQVVEGGRLEFRAGEVVASSARRGAEALAAYLGTDSGSRRLGEVALVDGSCPIGRSGLLFDSALLDENAACHIALGCGYDPAYRGAEALSDEEKEGIGFNVSIVHEDLMFGSDELCADGIEESGRGVPLLRAGRLAL